MRKNSRLGLAVFAGLLLAGCASSGRFIPKSDYPADPWVKGYSDPADCLGGEKLAAVNFELPDYPRRAFRGGRQGWVILSLDVDSQGQTQNVEVARALPEDGLFGGFEGAAVEAARAWEFEPPEAPLTACKVLIRFRFGSVSLGS